MYFALALISKYCYGWTEPIHVQAVFLPAGIIDTPSSETTFEQSSNFQFSIPLIEEGPAYVLQRLLVTVAAAARRSLYKRIASTKIHDDAELLALIMSPVSTRVARSACRFLKYTVVQMETHSRTGSYSSFKIIRHEPSIMGHQPAHGCCTGEARHTYSTLSTAVQTVILTSILLVRHHVPRPWS